MTKVLLPQANDYANVYLVNRHCQSVAALLDETDAPNRISQAQSPKLWLLSLHHSTAFARVWDWALPIQKFLAQHAVTNIVTNQHWANLRHQPEIT